MRESNPSFPTCSVERQRVIFMGKELKGTVAAQVTLMMRAPNVSTHQSPSNYDICFTVRAVAQCSRSG